ncbi:MAG: hypothetical protein P9L97_08005 [Candidatus Tenebribacter davisii]|nr:hypothetical protein [Candidatus Tenebribacter davisii]
MYYEKYIKYKGIIEDMGSFPYGKISIKMNEISAWFDEDGPASSLNKGHEIYFVGKIRHISEIHVILDECKLIDKD